MSNIPIFLKNIYIPIRIWIENNIINMSSKNDISQITDNIYIGNLSTSNNIKLLKEKGITHILSCTSHYTPLYPDDFTYKHIHAYDTLDYNLYEHFDESNQFMLKGTSNDNKIYVHCMYGASRSVALVIAFLIKQNNSTVEYVLNMIKNKRYVANPNATFMKQLYLYGSIL
jgi:hypothetical protein